MPTTYFINLNYVCNERCIFCAADLVGSLRIDGHRPWVTLEEIRAWVGDEPPDPDDRVRLAGGEPTLHKELAAIVRFLAARCGDVTLFTNGLRLADPAFAGTLVDAGITHFQIALFGATAAGHEAVTQIRGSFDRTLSALRTLAALRRERPFTLEVRLLVSRQSAAENPAIVRLLHQRVPRIDAVSLNRLILSDLARAADATISWAEARASINESARLVRAFGFRLLVGSIPFCVFDGDNADFVRQENRRMAARLAWGLEPSEWRMRYFDPLVAAGQTLEETSAAPVAMPAPCRGCDYRALCGRVEDWYVDRYGEAGLRTMRLGNPSAVETASAPT